MKIILLLIVVFIAVIAGFWFFGKSQKPKNAKSNKSIYDYSFTSLDGKKINMADFKGKKILIVNVASQCGFTPQYKELEELYQAHRDRVVVIGFPANNFMDQEPGSNDEIKIFCTARFGVTFPMSQKISVVGDSQSDLYQWLTRTELNGWNNQPPRWNFYKYLIDEKGELVNVFPSTTSPMNKEILMAIQQQE